MSGRAANAWYLIRDTIALWRLHKTPQLGAALAFYCTLSLAPLAVLGVALAGALFGQQAGEAQLALQIERVFGSRVAESLEMLSAGANVAGAGGAVRLLGVLTLLFGAARVFNQLQDALNTVWEVQPRPGFSVMRMFRTRVMGVVAVIVLGGLLMVTVAASAALSALGDRLAMLLLDRQLAVLYTVDAVLLLSIPSLAFVLLFKLLPDVEISWRDAAVGAGMTALLFNAGRAVLAYYLGTIAHTSTYGAAGALLIILFWTYYSAQIVFLGAEFTYVYSGRFGQGIVPAHNAIAVARLLPSSTVAVTGASGTRLPAAKPIAVPAALRDTNPRAVPPAGTTHALLSTIGLLAFAAGLWVATAAQAEAHARPKRRPFKFGGAKRPSRSAHDLVSAPKAP